MKKILLIINSLLILFVLIIIGIIFKTWLFSFSISAGDFEYYSLQRIIDIMPLGIWDPARTGLGASILPYLWLESYTSTSIKLSLLLGWGAYIKLFWYIPFLVFSFISSLILLRSLFKNNFLFSLASLIYSANTYSLMMASGGQMGIALSYSLAPFVYYFYIKLLNKLSLKNSAIFGLVFAFVSLLDIRIGYMLSFAIITYSLIVVRELLKNIRSTLFLVIIIPLLIVSGIHFFWLLPAVFSAKEAIAQLGDIYTSQEAVKYFSFATMENSFGLLHPNWPENIFGKVGFMKPEYLLLPIIAFSSILFIAKEEVRIKKYLIFFISLGLLGIFLAKGSNEPFGNLYIWLFDNIPGFVMFRDPTKWYSLIAVSYSILVPYSIFKIFIYLKNKFN